MCNTTPLKQTFGLAGLTAFLLLSPGPAPGETGNNVAATAIEERSTVTLGWLDPDQRLQSGFDTMAQEVNFIFGQIGVEVEWKLGDGRTIDRKPGEILVILQPASPPGLILSAGTMGAVSRQKESRHIVFVFHQEVAEAIGVALHAPYRITPLQRHELATAVGRVVAHEVIHAVAPAHPHGAEGIMQHRLSELQLVRGKLEISPRCLSAFVEGLLPETEAPTPVTTAR